MRSARAHSAMGQERTLAQCLLRAKADMGHSRSFSVSVMIERPNYSHTPLARRSFKSRNGYIFPNGVIQLATKYRAPNATSTPNSPQQTAGIFSPMRKENSRLPDLDRGRG